MILTQRIYHGLSGKVLSPIKPAIFLYWYYEKFFVCRIILTRCGDNEIVAVRQAIESIWGLGIQQVIEVVI